MLLRNIDQANGLCNDTLLQVNELGWMLLVVQWLQTKTLVIKYSFLKWTWSLHIKDRLSSFKEDNSQYPCALQWL